MPHFSRPMPSNTFWESVMSALLNEPVVTVRGWIAMFEMASRRPAVLVTVFARMVRLFAATTCAWVAAGSVANFEPVYTWPAQLRYMYKNSSKGAVRGFGSLLQHGK